jgi:ribonuclease III
MILDDPKANRLEKLAQVEAALSHRFSNSALLEQALTHPSLATDKAAPQLENNQRLEFLGDAVLQLILSSALYVRFPQASEGVLTKARAQLVNRHALASQGRSYGLGAFLFLSHGEEQNGGRQRASAIADCFEAVLGAIYLDAGLDAARQFVMRSFADGLNNLDEQDVSGNPKGELQELLQARSKESPHYEVKSASGPDHDRLFECAVYHAGQELARGTGKSKKEAESNAAAAALTHVKSPSPTPPASHQLTEMLQSEAADTHQTPPG